jgi:hypothetical protein
MLLIILVLLIAVGIIVNSFRLSLFALTALLIKAFPLVVLPGISAIAIWAIKVNLRK